MTSLSWTDDANNPSPGLRSLLSQGEGFFSSNPALLAGELTETPLKTVSVVLLALRDRRHGRWVLLEQDPGVECSSQWKFPGGPIPPGEMPLQVAVRAVTENICLLDAGLPVRARDEMDLVIGWHGQSEALSLWILRPPDGSARMYLKVPVA